MGGGGGGPPLTRNEEVLELVNRGREGAVGHDVAECEQEEELPKGFGGKFCGGRCALCGSGEVCGSRLACGNWVGKGLGGVICEGKGFGGKVEVGCEGGKGCNNVVCEDEGFGGLGGGWGKGFGGPRVWITE